MPHRILTLSARGRDCSWWRLVCCLVFVGYLATVPRVWQCENVDSVYYLSAAHSLANGFGYSLYGRPFVLYPPLLPLLMSAAIRIGGVHWSVLYAVNAFLGLFGIISMCAWLRRSQGRIGSCAAWCTVLSYYAWGFSTRYLHSEQAYVAASSVALIVAWYMLSRDRGDLRSSLLAATGTLCATMTRFSAVALIGALMAAGIGRWAVTRRLRPLIALLPAVLISGGFLVFWEIRAHELSPDAKETYGKWMTRTLGPSSESPSGDRGALGLASVPERIVGLAGAYAQSVTSIVRPPATLFPLALLLWFLFLSGLFRHIRQHPWSPIGWYTLLSMVLFVFTPWLSSYPRYLYTLTPMLFFFLFEGVRWWYGQAIESTGAWLRLRVGLFGVAGLLFAESVPPAAADQAETRAYVILGATILFLFYTACLVLALGARPFRLSLGALSNPRTRYVLFAAFAFHSVSLCALRHAMTLQDATPRRLNILGAIRCAQWVRCHGPRDASYLGSSPRILSFLSDRIFVEDPISPDGSLSIDGYHYILRIGNLDGELPQDKALEAAIDKGVAEAAVRGRVVLEFEWGVAAVYRVVPVAPPSCDRAPIPRPASRARRLRRAGLPSGRRCQRTRARLALTEGQRDAEARWPWEIRDESGSDG